MLYSNRVKQKPEGKSSEGSGGMTGELQLNQNFSGRGCMRPQLESQSSSEQPRGEHRALRDRTLREGGSGGAQE